MLLQREAASRACAAGLAPHLFCSAGLCCDNVLQAFRRHPALSSSYLGPLLHWVLLGQHWRTDTHVDASPRCTVAEITFAGFFFFFKIKSKYSYCWLISHSLPLVQEAPHSPLQIIYRTDGFYRASERMDTNIWGYSGPTGRTYIVSGKKPKCCRMLQTSGHVNLLSNLTEWLTLLFAEECWKGTSQWKYKEQPKSTQQLSAHSNFLDLAGTFRYLSLHNKICCCSMAFRTVSDSPLLIPGEVCCTSKILSNLCLKKLICQLLLPADGSFQFNFIHIKVITDTFLGTIILINVWSRRQVLLRIQFYYLKNIACYSGLGILDGSLELID